MNECDLGRILCGLWELDKLCDSSVTKLYSRSGRLQHTGVFVHIYATASTHRRHKKTTQHATTITGKLKSSVNRHSVRRSLASIHMCNPPLRMCPSSSYPVHIRTPVSVLFFLFLCLFVTIPLPLRSLSRFLHASLDS